MAGIVAIDWGTSSLRGALLDEQGAVLEERTFAHGILAVAPGGFRTVFDECFGGWMGRARLALVCGMAGSRQGWVEAPYASCPAGLRAIASQLAWIEAGRIAVVPGLSCDHGGVPDVMRGEETQVLGALALHNLDEAMLVLPGTHSKWVRARAGRIEAFRTFMTGEVYGLLRHHSILARGMPDGADAFDEPCFLQGLRHARASGNLLQAAFSARTLGLFERMAPQGLGSYLSGVVIGSELIGWDQGAKGPVLVVGAPDLVRRYTLALREAGAQDIREAGSEAAWRGLHAIAHAVS